MSFQSLEQDITSCRLCAGRFAATETAHDPRPVLWAHPGARILIAGQAPGMRVHKSGKPFTDPSGDRLRQWMGVGEDTFYDRDRIAIVPMAFCFPGYDAKGSDRPPPPICARTWRKRLLDQIPGIELTLLVGGHAQAWHLGDKATVRTRVAAWRDHAPRVLPLPHPSWRNTAWIKRTAWFEADLVPYLQTRVAEVLNG